MQPPNLTPPPPTHTHRQDMMKKFTSAEVAACHPQLRPEDVIVSTSKIDFTAGGGNPLDSVRGVPPGWQKKGGRGVEQGAGGGGCTYQPRGLGLGMRAGVARGGGGRVLGGPPELGQVTR